MTEYQTVATAVYRAVNAIADSAETKGVSVSDDGYVDIEARVEADEIVEIYQKVEDDDEDVKEDDTSSRDACDMNSDSLGEYEFEVHGTILGHNHLQKAVSASSAEFPADQTAENLADVAAELSETEFREALETIEVSNESDTNDGNDRMTAEQLKNQGVSEEDVETCMKLRLKNGECAANGCVYGAGDDSATCIKHDEDDITGGEAPVDNRDLSDLNSRELKTVDRLMNEEDMSAEEAIDHLG